MTALLAACLLATAFAWPARAGQAASAPPVILLSVDDLRADRVRPDLMPHLSALMSEAVYFSSAYAQGTWTVPSHASLFLSQYTATHDAGGDVGRLDFRAPREGPYLAGLLRERGYRTALYANTIYFEPEFRLARGVERNLVINPAVDPLLAAADWLAATSSATFLFLHTYAVHNFADIQDAPNRDAAGAWRCPPVIDPYKTETLLRWKKRQRLTCDQSRENYERAAYCFDAAFGAFVARLKASGLWDRALVAVVADHGEGLCDGPAGPETRQGHGALGYEEQLHVPWLLKLPGALHGGRRVDVPVQLIDVAPTILSALGLPVPPSFQGRDRLPEAGGAAGDPGAPVFAETDNGVAVRAEDWKLLWSWYDGYELYDLARDPRETRSLIGRAPERQRRLEALLREHQAVQRGAWKLAVRARRGEIVTVRVSADEPLRRARLLFTERADSLVLSSPTVATARFASARDGDEDWFLLDTAEPGAALRLEVSVDGRPAAAGLVRAGAATLEGAGPWTLEPGAVERADAPPAQDGVSLWRAPGGAASAKHVHIPSRIREALRHAGYAE